MNTTLLLSKTINLLTPAMHAAKRGAVNACVLSLLEGANACVTGIGRGIASSAYEKHSIKRADRLLSNPRLQCEVPGIYAAISHLFVSASKRPVIHIDWSDLDAYGRYFLIRASVAFDGRSITLYEEVHDINTKEKPATHKRFLRTLKQIGREHV